MKKGDADFDGRFREHGGDVIHSQRTGSDNVDRHGLGVRPAVDVRAPAINPRTVPSERLPYGDDQQLAYGIAERQPLNEHGGYLLD